MDALRLVAILATGTSHDCGCRPSRVLVMLFLSWLSLAKAGNVVLEINAQDSLILLILRLCQI